MGTINEYASTRCPLFGEGAVTTQKMERFDFFGPIVVGKDDTGYDVKFCGATTGAYFEYDESADRCNIIGTSSRAISGEEHLVDLTYGGTLSSGDGMVGLNVAVTPSGTAAAWVSGIYAKVTQGATKAVNGYISAAELEVINAAANVSDWFVLVLNAQNNGANQGSHSSYIALRDYGSLDIASLLWVGDHSIGTNDTAVLMSSTGAKTHSHSIRFIVGSTPYWIMCTSTGPAA